MVLDSWKPILLLSGKITTPPFSEQARRKAGFLLRTLQSREFLSMPDSRPMPSIGARCHELRISDPESQIIWRIIYRLDPDFVVIAEVFAKKTQRTPKDIISKCKARFNKYDQMIA